MRKISVRFPEDLLEEIDTVAELEYKDRTALMKEALRKYVDREIQEKELKEEATRRYLEGKLDYEKLVKVLGREEAQAVKSSKRIMDKGEELAQKLA